ncbi:MAG: CocE/NonD family hydrolase, partial [Vicinamibacteraceae bacterium]
RVVLLMAALGAVGFVQAGQDAGLRSRYTKQEVEITMRDGVKLFTIVYAPVDTSRAVPILMTRSPYGSDPYGPDAFRRAVGPSAAYEKDGYIFVYQDVRGRFCSGGEFVEMRPTQVSPGPTDVDESTDTYDTIAWLLKSDLRHNGRVGLWGVSYAGFYAAAALPRAHPALKAVSPQAPIADLFQGDDSYHNGAFMLAANFSFYTGFFPRRGGPAGNDDNSRFNYGTQDGYAFYLGLGGLKEGSAQRFPPGNTYWEDNLAHPTYDAFWQARAIAPHLRDVTPAVLTVGGWYDAEDLAGPLRIYRAIERQSPSTANRLVMGPWAHGGWSRGDGDKLGALAFGVKTGAEYRDRFERPFFEHHLRDAPLAEAPEAAVFVTGENAWRTPPAWPPADATPRTFYFAAGGTLAEVPPARRRADASRPEADEYVSDPNRPVPYVAAPGTGMKRDYMTEDQRFASTRPDVLVYQTPPLADDLTIAGPIHVSLQVSTTGTDADWVVKLIDVYPEGDAAPAGASGARLGGYQQLVRGEPFRGKFRDSFEHPAPFVPGRPAAVAFDLPDAAHTFRRGHRLMVHVQSSWFPLIDRNPQVFIDIPAATAADFRPATQRVWRSAERASSIRVLAVPAITKAATAP